MKIHKKSSGRIKGLRKKFLNIATKTRNINKTIALTFRPEKHILAYWMRHPDTANNWGDAINPWLITKLSGKKVIHIKDAFNVYNYPVYVAIGSVLQAVNFKNFVVWGAGFMYSDSKIKTRPRNILMVRGPLTRKLFMSSGIDCPETYGDPGLLFSQFYHPKVEKKYKLGLLPHYVDYNSNFVKTLREKEEVNVIDIKAGIYKVAEEVLKCEVIASSSLHGLILADSYGIPNTWIQLSDKITGGRFKFYDYYLGINQNNKEPLWVSETKNSNQIINSARVHDVFLDRILETSPFGSPKHL